MAQLDNLYLFKNPKNEFASNIRYIVDYPFIIDFKGMKHNYTILKVHIKINNAY